MRYANALARIGLVVGRALDRVVLCGLLDRHVNAECEAQGWRPLFPVVCDQCRTRFYMPAWTDAEIVAHSAARAVPPAETQNDKA